MKVLVEEVWWRSASSGNNTTSDVGERDGGDSCVEDSVGCDGAGVVVVVL